VDTTVALLAIILVLLGTLAVFAAFQGRGSTTPLATSAPGQTAAAVGTPNVVGKSVADATSALLAAGYGLVAFDVDNAARGTACAVARQQPAANATVSRGSTAMIWYVPGKDCTKGAKGKGD
jgi:beta-lactam-binding protein with PASTA domain